VGGFGVALARPYSLRRARAWIGLLPLALALLHCPASDPPRDAAGSAPPDPDRVAAAAAERAEATVAAAASAATAATAGSPATALVASTAARSPAPDRPVIVFLGTSLTAGLGLPESEAYPALIQDRIDRAGFAYRVVNAGVSGDTSAGGLRRLDWLLRLPIAVLVLELGANDMLRGQSTDALEANLKAILERTRAAHPGVRFVVEGMRAAPNLGRDYAAAFDAVYPRVAREFGAPLVPFLLEDVAARPSLNQPDGIHPTAEGHALIAERVWKTLEPVLAAGGAAQR